LQKSCGKKQLSKVDGVFLAASVDLANQEATSKWQTHFLETFQSIKERWWEGIAFP